LSLHTLLSRAVSFVLPLAAALCLASCRAQPPTTAAGPDPKTSVPRTGVIGCLGRIEAGDGIIHIAARALSGQPSIIAKLFVKDGDKVTAGQVLAELESRGQLEAAARQAEARIAVARSHVEQVQAGAKPSDLAAAQTEIERLQVELDNARKEHQRYSTLGNNVTASQLDALQLRIDSTTRALTAARQRLTSMTEIRPVDVAVARAELDEAIRTEARVRAERDATVIKAPIDGRVIKVHARPGEQVQNEGLLEMAPMEPMYVVAEVPESDILRVKVGQRATISGDGLPSPIQGTVDRISMKVLQNQLVRVDPVNFSDSRVVNTWIKIDDGRAVSNFLNMRVDVTIRP
jgi:HlyD family secretion protein